VIRAVLTTHVVIRPYARFGSYLGPAMRAHLEHMRALGYRYEREEHALLQWDRYLQEQAVSPASPLASVVHDWAKQAGTPQLRLQRLYLGRSLLNHLRRTDPQIPRISIDSRLIKEALRYRRQPYIYSDQEIERLLTTARSAISPESTLRPCTVYTMIVLLYCAGLRLGELVRLNLGDIDQVTESLTIRDTKFFKSRRVPLSSSAMACLREYLIWRERTNASLSPNAAVFWHEQKAHRYSVVTAGKLLVAALRAAGLKPMKGRVGPRIHDIRHTFVAHRILTWYREGVNPQSRLPYLSTYLGHKDLSSTLVYLTITQDILQQANERFRALRVHVLDNIDQENL
jgi:integrase/recombinase XerD